MRTGALEGQLGMDAALERAEQSGWVTEARWAIQRLAFADVVFSTDDLHAVLNREPPNANAWGAVVRSCIHDGLIVEVGTTRSRRPDAHGRRIGRYRRA